MSRPGSADSALYSCDFIRARTAILTLQCSDSLDRDADGIHSSDLSLPSDALSWGVLSMTESSDFDIRDRGAGRRRTTAPPGRRFQGKGYAGESKTAVILHLEHKIQIMEEQKVHLEEGHKRRERHLRAEIDRLGSLVHAELSELQQRQAALEATGPSLQAQLSAVRGQLADLHISEAMYLELARTPRDNLPLVDAVKLAVFESLRDLRGENERLRRACTADRAQCKTLEEEVVGLKHAVALAESRSAFRERDGAEEVQLLQARVERLDTDLRDMTVRAEVLSAKATMYDELKREADERQGTYDRMTEQFEALQASSAALPTLQTDLLQATHRVDLLAQDKAHLTMRNEHLERQVEHLKATLDARETRLEELEASRDGFRDRLLAGGSEASERLREDLERLRSESTKEMDKIRMEMERAFAAERVVLKEQKTEAEREAACARDRMERAQQQLEDSRAVFLSRMKEHSVKEAQLLGKIEVLLLEKQHMEAGGKESERRLRSAQAEADMFAGELRETKDSLMMLDQKSNKRINDLESKLDVANERLAHYEMIENDIDQAIIRAGSTNEAVTDDAQGKLTVIKALEGAVPMAMKRRVRQALALAARCSDLEVGKAKVELELREAHERVRKLEADVQVLRSRAKRVHQPQAYVLDEMDKLEERALAAERRAAQLASDLHKSEIERKHLRGDLFSLLQEQGALDELQAALESVVA